MITPEESEVILEAIDSALIDVHTGLPASVVAWYPPPLNTVDVELQTKRMLEKEDGTVTSETLPILLNVPVGIEGSTDYYTSFALAPGDTGFVHFSETSLDQWRAKGIVTSPSDVERHGLSGGVFYPKLRPTTKPLADVLVAGALFGKAAGVQIRATGTAMEVTSGGLPASVGGFVAMATLVFVELGKIATAITGLGGAYTPAPVASTNLKAD
jgi:hypothetical protein